MKILRIMVLLLIATKVFAQTDTVESRTVTSWIGDSTSIRYYLGALCFEQDSAKQYLHFKKILNHSALPLYYQTRDFTITKSTASLSMFRFARFDGNATLLNATSTILYIVDICNSANDSVLARIDTLACYIDAKGKLGYTCYPTSNEYPHCNLNNIRVGTSVYARLERIASLPPGVAIKDEMDSQLIHGYPPVENKISYNVDETEFDVDFRNDEVKKSKKNTDSIHIQPTPVLVEVFTSIPAFRYISKPLLAIAFPSARSGVVSVSATYTKDLLIDASQQYMIEESEIGAVVPPPQPDDRLDTTYHKQITAVVGQKLFEVAEQINRGDNFLLLASKRLPRGEYDVTVKMGNEILYKQKRTVF